MRKKDLVILEQTIQELLDENKISADAEAYIMQAMARVCNQDTDYEVQRQRNARLQARATWLETPEAGQLRRFEVGEWMVVPTEKKRIYRSVKNALNRSGEGLHFVMRTTHGIGSVLTRTE